MNEPEIALYLKNDLNWKCTLTRTGDAPKSACAEKRSLPEKVKTGVRPPVPEAPENALNPEEWKSLLTRKRRDLETHEVTQRTKHVEGRLVIIYSLNAPHVENSELPTQRNRPRISLTTGPTHFALFPILELFYK